ncbi:uncharacterized protein [Nicotiana tomentosiformis]|uniref:uncharacterized protein isoform X1 n=1 Tax=Nicotiana tomentosiformis TaxID=4098 RepID=UPI00087811CE|nr:uncharacterized protein LOC104120383 isoform X3 [Nicotiana tomentosiformis]
MKSEVCIYKRKFEIFSPMADSTSQKRVTRGSTANTAAERRIKIRNDTLKEAQVEKSSKESTLPVAEKRKKPMDDASGVKGKEVDARNSSDTRDEKVIVDVSICI